MKQTDQNKTETEAVKIIGNMDIYIYNLKMFWITKYTKLKQKQYKMITKEISFISSIGQMDSIQQLTPLTDKPLFFHLK